MAEFGKKIAIAILAVVAICACVYFAVRLLGGPAPNVRIYFKDQAPGQGGSSGDMGGGEQLLRLGGESPRLVSQGEVFRIPIFMRVTDFLRDKTSISLEFRIAPRFWFELVEVTGGDFGTPSCENYYESELQAGVKISVSFPPDLVENHEGEEKLIAEVALKMVENRSDLFFPQIGEVVLIDRDGNPTISERDLKVLHLEPTVKEIQLQRENGGWVTIWSGEKPMFLKPGDPAKFLDEAHIPEGTYVASRVAYSGFMVAFDANGDGDENDVLDIVRSYVVAENFRETNQYYLPHEVTEGQVNALRLWGFPVDYCNDFAEGYFRAVWPGPWHYDGSVGEIVFDLRFGWEFVKLLGVSPSFVKEHLCTNFNPNFPVNTVAVAAPSPWEKVPTILQVSPSTFPILNKGQSIAFAAILTDSNGNLLLGRDVSWSASAGSILPTSGWTSIGIPGKEVSEDNPFGYVCHTGSAGIKWCKFVYLETEGAAPVTITASFAGDNWYEASSWSYTAAPPVFPTVGITFDGSSADWKQRYEPLGVDQVGDVPNADEDLKSIYAIDDGNYLYFMIEFSGTPSPAGAAIFLDTNSDGVQDYNIGCGPGGVSLDRTLQPDNFEHIADLGYACKEIIESKVPLEAIGSPSVVKLQVFSRGTGSSGPVDWMIGYNSWLTYPKEAEPVPTLIGISLPTFVLQSENSIVLTATLTDENGNPIREKTISWSAPIGTIEPASGVTNTFGQVSITYAAPGVGGENPVTIMAWFAGDNAYRESSGSAAGTITPSPGVQLSRTTLTVSPATFTLEFENSTVLTATLTDENGNLLEGKTISWGATSGAIEPTSWATDTSGQVSITYTAPAVSEESLVTVTATFAGDNVYGASGGSAAGTITPPPGVQLSRTTLTIEPSTFTLESENSITLTATLTDAGGNPLEGKMITFSVTEGTVMPNTGVTDSSGKASIAYTAPTVSVETSVTVSATFSGDDKYGPSSGVSQGSVTPAPPATLSTSLTIEPSSFTVGPEDSIALTVTLVDANGGPLGEKTVALSATAGNLSLTSRATDASGRVSITYTAPLVGEQTSVTISAAFGGDDRYEASGGSSTGSVSPP